MSMGSFGRWREYRGDEEVTAGELPAVTPDLTTPG